MTGLPFVATLVCVCVVVCWKLLCGSWACMLNLQHEACLRQGMFTGQLGRVREWRLIHSPCDFARPASRLCVAQ